MTSVIVIVVMLVLLAAAGGYGYVVWRRRDAALEAEGGLDDRVELYDDLDGWDIRRVDRHAPAASTTAGGGVPDHDDVDMGDLGELRADPEEHAAPARSRPRAQRATTATATSDGEQLIVALSLMAPPEAPFAGEDLWQALEEAGLVHGDMDIFHHHGMGDAPPGTPVFSIASIVEPGTFRRDEMAGFTTPGIALFMQLPGPMDGQVGLELMLSTAQRLRERLGGELRDERRSVLTQQTVAHLRERIAEYNRRRLVAAG